MSARREELNPDRRPALRRAGLPGHVARRPGRAARRPEALALPPHRLEGGSALGGRLGGRRGLPRGARRRAGRGARDRADPPRAARAPRGRRRPARHRDGLRPRVALPGGRAPRARSSPSAAATRSGSASSSATGSRGASCAPISTSRPRRCSSSRRPTGPTPGCARAPTPMSSPTASTRPCSTACAATRPRPDGGMLGSVKRAALIVNPYSTHVTGERIRAVERVLRERVEVADEFTQHPGHATELAAESRGDVDAIVVFSGDGTYNEALNGADGAVPFGFLPGGGTSVLPRALGLPRDPVAAARAVGAALAEGRTRRISLGAVNGRRFCFSAGIGFDGEAVRRLDALGRDAGRRAPRRPRVRAHGHADADRASRPLGAAARDRRCRPRRVHPRRELRSVLVRGLVAAAGRAGRASSSTASTSSRRRGCGPRRAAARPLHRPRPGAARSRRRRSRVTTSTGSSCAATGRCRCRPTARISATSTEAMFEARRDAVSVLV